MDEMCFKIQINEGKISRENNNFGIRIVKVNIFMF